MLGTWQMHITYLLHPGRRSWTFLSLFLHLLNRRDEAHLTERSHEAMARRRLVLSGGGLVAESCPTLCDPMDCSPPGSSVHGIPRQEYWSGLPFLSPGDLPDPGIEPGAPTLQADCFFNQLSYEGSPEVESSKHTHRVVNLGISASSPVGKLRRAARPWPRVRGCGWQVLGDGGRERVCRPRGALVQMV